MDGSSRIAELEASLGQVEEELRHSRLLFDQLDEAFALHEILCDGDGRPQDYRFLEVNPAFQRMTGLRKETILGKRVLEVLPGLESHWIDRYGEVALTGKSVRFESYSGRLQRDYEVLAYCPRIGQFATLFLDVTERKRAEAECRELMVQLRQANAQLVEAGLQNQQMVEEARRRAAQLDAVVESTHALLALLDRDMNFVMVNSAYAAGSGHTREELIGRNHFELFPNPENQAIFERVRDTGKPYQAIEKPFEYADQPWRGVTYWNWTFVPIRSHGRQVEGLLLSLLDVTPQVLARQQVERLAEEAAHHAAQLDATISAMAEGIVIYGRAGEIVRMNPAAEEIHGYSAEERVLPLEERLRLRHVETAEGALPRPEEAAAWRALQGETVLGTVMILHTRQGVSMWASCSASPIKGARGEVTGAVAVVTDITLLHRLREQSEDLVRTISHDLRNPLTAIHGHAQLLARELETATPRARLQRSAEAIVASTKRMDAMIQDLVDSARLESGQLPLRKQPTALGPFMVDMLQRSGGALEVGRLRVDIPSELPLLDVDQDRLERVLANLIDNALKYSEGEVAVRAERIEGQVRVLVIDWGQGIHPGDLPHLFDRFYRARGTRKAEGLGLGLYIARMLVEAMGGQISVESKLGRGSTFCFTLQV